MFLVLADRIAHCFPKTLKHLDAARGSQEVDDAYFWPTKESDENAQNQLALLHHIFSSKFSLNCLLSFLLRRYSL